MYAELVKQINQLQKTIDGLIRPEVSRWMGWTPTVTQSGAVAVTVNSARYVVDGNTVILRAQLTCTAAGTAGNAVVIGGLPFSIASVTGIMGVFEINDVGTAYYNGSAVVASATTFVGRAHNQGNNIGVTPNFALAIGDVISFQATYERA